MTMVRSQDWKLVHFLGEPFGQLFNLAEDPKENVNLWDEPACQDRKAELLDVMRDWLLQSSVKAASISQSRAALATHRNARAFSTTPITMMWRIDPRSIALPTTGISRFMPRFMPASPQLTDARDAPKARSIGSRKIPKVPIVNPIAMP